MKAAFAVALLASSAAFGENEAPIAAWRFGISIDGVQIASAGVLRGQLPDALVNPKLRVAAIAKPTLLQLQVDASAPQKVFHWMQQSLSPSVAPRHTLELTAEDGTRGVMQGALLGELTFPSLDGSSQKPVFLGLAVLPQRIEIAASRKLAARATAPSPKRWLASGFDFEIGGLPPRSVAKIDSFTVKQSVIEDQAGAKQRRKGPRARISISELKLTVSSSQRAVLSQWQASRSSKTAQLVLLDERGKRWARLALQGAQVSSVSPPSQNYVFATLRVASVTLNR
jgi:hypothetical protein